MNKHQLPWQSRPSINAPQLCHLFDAAGDVVAVGLTDEEADTILAAVNPTAKLVEALEACKAAMYKSEDCGCTDHLDATADAGKFWTDALYAARDALAEFNSD
jgi:hypothetical protein